MKNLIQATVVALSFASAAQAQEAPAYFRRVSIADQANIQAQNTNCPGFSNGSLYPLGEAVYAGIPFQHGPAERYAFMGGYYCGDSPRSLSVQVSAPGTATIYTLLSSWNGCGTQGPNFILNVSFADGTSTTWELVNGVDYRDHNGSCPLNGDLTQEVWSSGAGQHLDLLTLRIESSGNSISELRIESSDPWSPLAAPFVFGITIADAQDCNGDGIADWGQCQDSTLPDYNGNSIPDCCERGEACVVGSYPVQWRTADGGNGHWYGAVADKASFDSQQSMAAARGAMVVCVADAEENAFVYRFSRARGLPAIWIGMVQDPWGSEPDGGWRWIDDSGSSWRNWGVGEPNNWQYDEDNCVMIVTPAPIDDAYWPSRWQDYPAFWQIGAIIEWSADCNNDGIVDYGQILQGQLADTNTDGIPDVCQCATNPSLPTCCPGDLDHDSTVGGADIGLLLSNWGPCGSACIYDLNNDSKVNGGDLGLLLAGWGPCPN
jgi:hypothetical protein